MILDLSLLLPEIASLELFARSGGGGSSSGGGDGGGILLLFGYAPMHFLGSLLKKKMDLATASVIGWVIAVIYFFVLTFIFDGLGIWIGVAALVGVGAGLYGWFDKIAKLSGIAKKNHQVALQKDSSWDIDKLNQRVSEVFVRYQADWSNNDSQSMQAYLSPKYLYHNQLMIHYLKQIGRRNVVNNPAIKSMDIIDVYDDNDNTKDYFIMAITAAAVDDLYDEKINNLLYRDNSQFIEYWKFIRPDGVNWLLDGISQDTEDLRSRNNVIANFAAANNYCYSLDWGWLLLPSRGQLFGGAKFGTSDINNHVIGVYNNTLIQIYSYVPVPASSGSKSKNYLIAQVALPKSYGNIVVRKKRAIDLFGIKGLTRVSMEWRDFNSRYEVWASDMERVTSFELLNPSFMVKLQELPFEVNIEVVDNTVYLYSANIPATDANYDTLLKILYQAFKEMRM